MVLLISILSAGLPSFQQTFLKAEIYLDPAVLDPSGERDPEAISKILTFSYSPMIKGSLTALAEELEAQGAENLTPQMLADMVSGAANAKLRDYVMPLKLRIMLGLTKIPVLGKLIRRPS